MESVQAPLQALNKKYSFVVAENQQLHSQASHEMRQGIQALEDKLHEFQLEECQLHAVHTAESKISHKNIVAVYTILQELNTKYNSVVIENQTLRSELNDEKRAFKKSMETVNEKYSFVVAENQQVHIAKLQMK